MYIMTKDGWKQRSPANCIPAPQPTAYNGIPAPYVGSFPSKQVVAFFNEQKERMKYFDDGIRMVYGKADRIVEVDNATPIHPIANPPIGF